MTESRRLLQHYLAALAYRTQKALRNAPSSYGEVKAGAKLRTPHENEWHMTRVIEYSRMMIHDGLFRPERLDTFDDEIDRFHATLHELHTDFANPELKARITDDQFL